VLDLDWEEKYRLAKRMDATANRAAALPRTTIRRTVWPTPGTKNAGVIPSSATIAYNAMKPRTPPYAKIRIDLRIFALFCVEGPRDHVLLTTWKMDATSAPVFDIVIAGFGPVGRFVSQPAISEVVPHASAPLPRSTRNVQPFCT